MNFEVICLSTLSQEYPILRRDLKQYQQVNPQVYFQEPLFPQIQGRIKLEDLSLLQIKSEHAYTKAKNLYEELVS